MASIARAQLHQTLLNPTLLIVSLGNFIDAFDLFLFSALRASSLEELGLSGEALTRAGLFIMNCQVAGMFFGGILWGVLGDKIGRKKAIIGAVLLYSLGSLACAFVSNVELYAFLRFVTGLGLAGELGLGAILVTETVPDNMRNGALCVFACFSAIAIFASNALPELLSWRGCYAVGGIAGLVILCVRMLIFESTLFASVALTQVKRGSLAILFKDRALMKRWISCVLVYAPQCFMTGFVMTLVPEIGSALGVPSLVKANIAFMIYFSGQFCADILGILLSAHFRRRLPVLLAFMVSAALMLALFLTLRTPSAIEFYLCCAVMGMCSYFVLSIFVTIEQFGVNMRATAGTSAISASRTTLVFSNTLYFLLFNWGMTTLSAIASVSALVFALGFVGLLGVSETFSRGMNFIENIPGSTRKDWSAP